MYDKEIQQLNFWLPINILWLTNLLITIKQKLILIAVVITNPHTVSCQCHSKIQLHYTNSTVTSEGHQLIFSVTAVAELMLS